MNMAEAKAKKGLVDAGSDGRWKTDASAPGDGRNRVGWRCNAHIGCAVQLQACRMVGGFGFRVRGEHSTEENTKRRSNAAMTFEQEASTRNALASGGKPGGIVVAMTKEELRLAKEAGTDSPKRPEGGLAGTQTRNTVARMAFSCNCAHDIP